MTLLPRHVRVVGDPVQREFATDYTVRLGADTRDPRDLRDLRALRRSVAHDLGTVPGHVLVQPGSSPDTAIVTHITGTALPTPRFYAGPRVEGGKIQGVARLIDGSGTADARIWNAGRMVHTVLHGHSNAPMVNAARILMYGALSTSVINLIYASVFSYPGEDLAQRARLAVIGHDNLVHLPRLVEELMVARDALAARLQLDNLVPTCGIPGWMIFHNHYDRVAGTSRALAHSWGRAARTMGALGLWGVALAREPRHSYWGDREGYMHWAMQLIVFTPGSSTYHPFLPDLPFDPDDLRTIGCARPRQFLAAHHDLHSPTLWDQLPSDMRAADIAECTGSRPLLTTTTAVDQHFYQPQPHPVDVEVFTRIFGAPTDDGRWHVGPGGKHSFPSSWH